MLFAKIQILHFLFLLFLFFSMNRRQFTRLCKQATSSHRANSDVHHHHHHQSTHPPTTETSEGQNLSVVDHLNLLRQRTPSSAASSRKPPETGFALSQEIAAYGFIDDEVLGAMRRAREVVTHRVPGPAPPPSWRPTFHKAKYRPAQRGEGRSIGERTLEELAMTVVANHLPLFVEKPGDRRLKFSLVPAHLKEQILQLAAVKGRLTDQTISLFEDESLRTLNIGASTVTVAGLQSLVPALAPPRKTKGWDDWENLAGGSSGGGDEEDTDDDDDDASVQVRGCPSLEELILSFSLRMEGVTLALLLVEHWKALRVLVVAGCFTMTDGPPALQLVSEGLPSLVLLDLTECFWVTTRLLTDISWTEHLTRLETLRLVGCQFVQKRVEPKLRTLANRSNLSVEQ